MKWQRQPRLGAARACAGHFCQLSSQKRQARKEIGSNRRAQIQLLLAPPAAADAAASCLQTQSSQVGGRGRPPKARHSSAGGPRALEEEAARGKAGIDLRAAGKVGEPSGPPPKPRPTTKLYSIFSRFASQSELSANEALARKSSSSPFSWPLRAGRARVDFRENWITSAQSQGPSQLPSLGARDRLERAEIEIRSERAGEKNRQL